MNELNLSELRIALTGATGRMGKAILQALLCETNISLQGVVAHPNSKQLGLNVWENLGEHTQTRSLVPLPIQSRLQDLDPNSFDMVIDVSLAGATKQHMDYCCRHKKKLVLGTTGISESVYRELRKAAAAIPLLYAPNFSLGMAFLEHTLQQSLPWQTYDAHILETHHRHKQDKPSGSAKRLQEAICLKNFPRSLQIDSLRAGEIFGEHQVRLIHADEELVLTHRAFNRHAFAYGAVKAMYWLKAQSSPGLYFMRHIVSEADRQ